MGSAKKNNTNTPFQEEPVRALSPGYRPCGPEAGPGCLFYCFNNIFHCRQVFLQAAHKEIIMVGAGDL